VFVPKTAGGKFAQNLVTFGATMSTAWRALPKATGKVGVAIKAEVSSGIADIITTKKGDPNLTGLIKGLLPEELQDNLGLIDYLISDEDDTAASARVKAILEGSGISAAAAVAIRGLKAARKSYALSTTGEVKSDPDAPVPGKRGKTKSNQDKIEAFQQALRAANEEMTKAADEVAQAATRESELFADITLRSQDDIQARLDEIAVQRQELEEMGLSGCHMEDQIMVKRCGHLDNKTLVSRDEMVAGLSAGSFLLPRSLSISFRLIEDWFDAGRAEGTPTLRELGAGRTW
jgi:hypothetical protein